MISVIPDQIESFGNEVGNAWPIIVLIIACVGFASGFIRFVVRQNRKEITSMIEPMKREMLKNREEIKEMIEPIKKELQTNGGSSLKDQMNFLVSKYNSLDGSVKDLYNYNLANHARTMAIASGVDTGYYEIDENGILVRMNHFYLKLLGLTEDEAEAGLWIETVHPDDRDRVVDSANNALSAKKEWHTTYRLINYITKEETRVRIKAYPMLDDAGNLKGYVGAVDQI